VIAPTAEPAPSGRSTERGQAFKRVTFLVLFLIVLASTVRSVFGQRGMLDALRSRHERTRLEAEVARWMDRNARLEARVKALREDPIAIEALARERLGWIRPGEITFLFPYDPAALAPGDPAPVLPGEFSPTLGEEPDASAEQQPRPAP
jgi:cell division protein FtsB